MKIQEMNLHNKNSYCIDYDITQSCNNRCPYCCVMDDLDNTKIFNEKVFEQVISAVNSFKHRDSICVTLLGGDPLLIPFKVHEFVERIKCNVTIYSNLNYNPLSDNIQIAKKLDANFINSWHSSSNIKYVKDNILLLRDRIKPILMVDNTNIDEMFENSKWLIEQDINYSVQFIRNKKDAVLIDTHNEKVKEMCTYAIPNSSNTIDGVLYNDIESLDMDLLNIAMRHKVLCRLYMIRVLFNGELKPLCNNPIQLGHIENGLSFHEILCSGNNCLCDTRNYKRILNVS